MTGGAEGIPTDAETVRTLTDRLKTATQVAEMLQERVEELARQVEATRQWRWLVLAALGFVAIVVAIAIVGALLNAHENDVLSHQRANASSIHNLVVEACDQRMALRLTPDPICEALTP